MSYISYSSSQIAFLANSLNRRYNKERLRTPMPADVYDVTDLLGARIAVDYLTPDRSILGMTLFKPKTLWVWPDGNYIKGMLPIKRTYNENTILLDRSLGESGIEEDRYIENFTAMHEAFHFCRHKAFFCDAKSDSTVYTNLEKSNSKMQKLKWIEGQADYAAAAFLMPREAIFNAAREYLDYDGRHILKFGYRTKEKIKQIRHLFGVNYSPLVYRLQKLGILERYFDSNY